MTFPRSARHAALAALASATIFPIACSRDVLVGENLATLADARAGSPGAGGADSADCQPAYCQNHLYRCGNCEDDDGDGLIDMADPDCLGPCHNSENMFFGDIPGQNKGNCIQDCYFDQDSGGGNDDCAWSHQCDVLSVAPDFPPAGPACAYDPATIVPRAGGPGDCATLAVAQSVQCVTSCGPLTPNGCDCFGCCEVQGAPTPIWMGSLDESGNPTCDLAHVADPTRCKPCSQVPGCLNPCGECELCVGKTTLPAACEQNGCATPVCPFGRPSCGTPCLAACRSGETCITGCCVQVPR